jgi:hypothetical protein
MVVILWVCGVEGIGLRRSARGAEARRSGDFSRGEPEDQLVTSEADRLRQQRKCCEAPRAAVSREGKRSPLAICDAAALLARADEIIACVGRVFSKEFAERD